MNENRLTRLTYAGVPTIPLKDLTSKLQSVIYNCVRASSFPLVIFLHQTKHTCFRVVHSSEEKETNSETPLTCTLNKLMLTFSDNFIDVNAENLLKPGVEAFWRCPICETIVECQSSTLTEHARQHMEKMICYFCSEEIRSPPAHKCKAKHSKKARICPHCSKYFSTVQKLQTHMQSQHYGRTVGSNRFECPVCGADFSSYRERETHRKVHKRAESHSICEKCNKTFDSMVKLERHRADVHPSNYYQCDICTSVFKTASNLRVHVKEIHEASSQVTCSVCQKVFRQKRNLVRHMNTVHVEGAKNLQTVSQRFSVVYYDPVNP